MNTKLLNAAVSHLRSLGVVIDSSAAAKNAVISLCVLTLVESGMPVQAALDSIVGAGTSRAIADSFWASVNAA